MPGFPVSRHFHVLLCIVLLFGKARRAEVAFVCPTEAEEGVMVPGLTMAGATRIGFLSCAIRRKTRGNSSLSVLIHYEQSELAQG